MENPFLQLLKLNLLRPYKFFLLYLICQQILLPLLLKYPQYLTISYHLHPGPNYPFTWFITTAAKMVFLFLPLYSYYLLLDTMLLLCSKPSSRLSLHSEQYPKSLLLPTSPPMMWSLATFLSSFLAFGFLSLQPYWSPCCSSKMLQIV